eukprot:2963973-Lingulodinium_polyedra.AAC.1
MGSLQKSFPDLSGSRYPVPAIRPGRRLGREARGSSLPPIPAKPVLRLAWHEWVSVPPCVHFGNAAKCDEKFHRSNQPCSLQWYGAWGPRPVLDNRS